MNCSQFTPCEGRTEIVDADGRLIWHNDDICMVFVVRDNAPVVLAGLSGYGMRPACELNNEKGAFPIVEVLTSISGRTMNHQRLTDTREGSQLRFVAAYTYERGMRHVLRIDQKDEHSGLLTETEFSMFPGVSAVSCQSRIASERRLPVEAVSSLNLTVPLDAAGGGVDGVEVYWADSTWAAENNWHQAPLREIGLPDINTNINPRVPGARFNLSSRSTWSTGEKLPLGVLTMGEGIRRSALIWQIEHNGPWTWEIGEGIDGLHITAGGPNGDDHQWAVVLDERTDFVTVPASFAICSGGWQQVVEQMTLHRRALRSARLAVNGQNHDSEQLVIYNDYMNTLFGNPTADKELPLIEGAGKLGVDVFCIDAGWYDSADGGWWDMVGEWKPSTNRFGNLGLKGIASAIRKAGMGLGLWLEPEVVGVRSPIANELPDSAFFCRHGERVADDGRYHLDFRSPDARAHMDDTMERIIAEFQPKFFKFDYNTVPGVGTEIDAGYLGEGLLGHSRAYVRWLDDLKHRHPELVIENCGSGAMRADYAMLQRLDLQSTSDQCDPAIYAAIAAGASMSILPEQQGNWGYAQQEMDDETAVFTLAAGIAGRLYLSGFVNRMDERRLRLIRGAIEAHRQVLRNQSGQVPFWPLGLPVFSGDWLASGLLPYADNNETGYMTIWHRGGANSVVVEVPQGATLRPFFPKPGLIDKSHGAVDWHVEPLDGTHVRLTVSDNRRSARVYAIDMPDSTK